MGGGGSRALVAIIGSVADDFSASFSCDTCLTTLLKVREVVGQILGVHHRLVSA